VRSGVLNSIHAFGASTLGVPFLALIASMIALSIYLVATRSDALKSENRLDSLLSREAVFLLNNFVFKDQDLIVRHRLFFGAKLQYYVFQLTLEASFALAGSSLDDRSGTSDACLPNSMTTVCDAKDTAKSQRTLSMSAGFDF
jgi:hypothetical protein